jgi:hypothetical protein
MSSRIRCLDQVLNLGRYSLPIAYSTVCTPYLFFSHFREVGCLTGCLTWCLTGYLQATYRLLTGCLIGHPTLHRIRKSCLTRKGFASGLSASPIGYPRICYCGAARLRRNCGEGGSWRANQDIINTVMMRIVLPTVPPYGV